jgi:hypothetical protein
MKPLITIHSIAVLPTQGMPMCDIYIIINHTEGEKYPAVRPAYTT